MSRLCHSDKKLCRNTIIIITGIIFIITGVMGYRIWKFPWLLDELLRTENTVIANCRKSWGGSIELSREIESRLQTVMPHSQQHFAIKTGGGNYGGTYWFGFFGIDKTRGYLLTNSVGYAGLIEKSYPRQEAEMLFDELTRDYAKLTNYSDIRSAVHPGCSFMTITLATSSKQIQILGSTLHARKDETGVALEENAFRLLFNKQIEQAHANQTREAFQKARIVSYERDRKAGHTFVDYENQVKRAAENIFYELPDGK